MAQAEKCEIKVSELELKYLESTNLRLKNLFEYFTEIKKKFTNLTEQFNKGISSKDEIYKEMHKEEKKLNFLTTFSNYRRDNSKHLNIGKSSFQDSMKLESSFDDLYNFYTIYLKENKNIHTLEDLKNFIQECKKGKFSIPSDKVLEGLSDEMIEVFEYIGLFDDFNEHIQNGKWIESEDIAIYKNIKYLNSLKESIVEEDQKSEIISKIIKEFEKSQNLINNHQNKLNNANEAFNQLKEAETLLLSTLISSNLNLKETRSQGNNNGKECQ